VAARVAMAAARGALFLALEQTMLASKHKTGILQKSEVNSAKRLTRSQKAAAMQKELN